MVCVPVYVGSLVGVFLYLYFVLVFCDYYIENRVYGVGVAVVRYGVCLLRLYM